MIEKLEKQFTRYEVARILGARALQIAMDAPLLLKLSEKELEEINYNPIEIAKKELESQVLPITVNRPLPKRKESKLKKLSKEEIEEIKRKEMEKAQEAAPKEKKEHVIEEIKKEVIEDAEIMELATPEDEVEDSNSAVSEEEGV